MAASSVDDYMAGLPPEAREVLEKIRKTLHRAVPGADEKISYGVPTLTRNGRNVVHFGGYKNHVAVYPIPDGDEAFEQAVAPYRASKGTLKIPLGEKVPYGLIEQAGRLLAAART